ncbi:hypothetical protein VU04_06110, partial [Desulfobulbus sp. TB]|nr:hypothetical protein [Desulfobulbus sp. TB]
MEELVNILQYLKNHPEVTWSGAGLTGLSVLYFLIKQVFMPFSRKERTPLVSNTCTNSGSGDQNIAQGEGAVGKQENVGQDVDGDNSIFSGTGNVTVHQGLSLKPRTMVLASVLAAGIIGAGVVGWHWLAPPLLPNNTISLTGNNDGEQNIAQGEGAIGKQVNNYGIPYEEYRKLSSQLDVTETALANFFKILEEQQVPHSDLDAKLREIASHYKKLLRNWESVQSTDPQVVKMKAEARQAIDTGNYTKAERLLIGIAQNQRTLHLKPFTKIEKMAPLERHSEKNTQNFTLKTQSTPVTPGNEAN